MIGKCIDLFQHFICANTVTVTIVSFQRDLQIDRLKRELELLRAELEKVKAEVKTVATENCLAFRLCVCYLSAKVSESCVGRIEMLLLSCGIW